MRKILQLFLSICCIFLLVSCQKGSSENIDHTEHSSSSGIIVNDPKPEYPGSIEEIDSSNIETELYQPVTTKSDKITIKITGSNAPNNSIYMFTWTALEKEDNSEWRRIPSTEDIAQFIIGEPGYFWSTCTREDTPDYMWTTSDVFVTQLAEGLQTGSYRTVSFFPDRTVYTYFEISE